MEAYIKSLVAVDDSVSKREDIPLARLQRLWQKERGPAQADGSTAPSSWTALMHALMAEAAHRGHAPSVLQAAMACIPVFPGALAAVAAASAAGARQLILSDANSVLVQAFMQAQGLGDTFNVVLTNPAVEQEGRVAVAPFQPLATPHACPLPCPSNLCKGGVLQAYLSATYGGEAAWPTLGYVGDGAGDTCAVCQLSPSSTAFVRKGYALQTCLETVKGRGEQGRAEVAVPFQPAGEEGAWPAYGACVPTSIRVAPAQAKVCLWADGEALQAGIQAWLKEA